MSKKEKGYQVFRMNFIGCLTLVPMLISISYLVRIAHEFGSAPSRWSVLVLNAPVSVPMIWGVALIIYSNFMKEGEVKVKKMISDDLLDG